MTTLDVAPAPIKRDRYGRPLVVPPTGGKPVGYTRATTYVSTLEDTYNLGLWSQRMVALGLASRPDLLLAVAATDKTDKQALDRITTDAREAAASSAAATTGTALHALCERMDRGQEVGVVPAAYLADLAAYQVTTTELTAVLIEQFSVLDELRIGGTPDRVVEFRGKHYIADIKTGSIQWGAGKIAMQLAVYAHSTIYDHTTSQRSPLPPVDQARGIVIHLPAGTGQCTLHWVDIAAGWEAVSLATTVREWRNRRDLIAPVDVATIPDPASGLHLLDEVRAAPTVEALTALWVAHQPTWTDELTAAAAQRKTHLNKTAAAVA